MAEVHIAMLHHHHEFSEVVAVFDNPEEAAQWYKDQDKPAPDADYSYSIEKHHVQ